jgi:hypothetical protein
MLFPARTAGSCCSCFLAPKCALRRLNTLPSNFITRISDKDLLVPILRDQAGYLLENLIMNTLRVSHTNTVIDDLSAYLPW